MTDEDIQKAWRDIGGADGRMILPLYEFARAIERAVLAKLPGMPAYWAAIDQDGNIEYSLSADDANEGGAARQEINDRINNRLNNGGGLLHLVALYKQPAASEAEETHTFTHAQLMQAINALSLDSRANVADFDIADAIWDRLHGHSARLPDRCVTIPPETASESGAVPVAYRYRHSETEKWHYGEHPQSWWECQALALAAPPSTPAAQPDYQEAAQIARDMGANSMAETLDTAAQPEKQAEQGVAIPLELANRLSEALGRFTGDEGWGQDDMDAADELSALLAAPPAPIQQAAHAAEPVPDMAAELGLNQHAPAAESAEPIGLECERCGEGPEQHTAGHPCSNQSFRVPTAATADAQGDERAASKEELIRTVIGTIFIHTPIRLDPEWVIQAACDIVEICDPSGVTNALGELVDIVQGVIDGDDYELTNLTLQPARAALSRQPSAQQGSHDGQQHAGKEPESAAQDGRDDTGAIGGTGRVGTDQHNEHRVGQADADHQDDQRDSGLAGIQGGNPIPAKVNRQPSAPASAVPDFAAELGLNQHAPTSVGDARVYEALTVARKGYASMRATGEPCFAGFTENAIQLLDAALAAAKPEGGSNA